VATILAAGLPVVAGAGAGLALSPPSAGTALAALLFFVLALLADSKPVPIDERGEHSVSLAFIFILASQLIFGWEIAVLTASLSILVAQLSEQRPLVRAVFNTATYGLAALASSLPGLLAPEGGEGHGALIVEAFAGGALFVAVNVLLVSTVISLASETRLRPVLIENARCTGPAFAVMAFLAALAAALWLVEPVLLMLLTGPLFLLGLYQRASLSSRIATLHAHTDSLTGLGNHRSYQLALREAIERAKENEASFGLLLVDVDNFKRVNDIYGHPAGDEILIEIARVLRAVDGAAAFRFGGDELALLLPGDRDACLRAAERVRAAVAGGRPGPQPPVTLSVGIACAPMHAAETDRLQQLADAALYSAKRRGKNRSCLYDPARVRVYTPAELARQAERQGRLRGAENLVQVVDAKDAYAGRHSQAVAELARGIAEQLDASDEVVEQVALAGLLHDLGKIAIPDAVLQKPGRLDLEERRLIRSHSELGYHLLEGLELDPVDRWILHHHEHWDGSGYPHGLAGESIPIGSRIILVADAFHAITSERTYHPARSFGTAVRELRAKAWRQFDGTVVEALVAHLERSAGWVPDESLPAAVSG
jgi:diguanylate cyclase (GGDEF)-like protein